MQLSFHQGFFLSQSGHFFFLHSTSLNSLAAHSKMTAGTLSASSNNDSVEREMPYKASNQADRAEPGVNLGPAETPVLFELPPADAPLSWSARIFLIFVLVVGISLTASSSKPGQTFAAFCLAVLPSLFIFALIAYRLRDPVVSKSFLIGQTFLSSVPGVILVTFIGMVAWTSLSVRIVCPAFTEAYKRKEDVLVLVQYQSNIFADISVLT